MSEKNNALKSTGEAAFKANKIIMARVDNICPYPGNAKIHDDDQIAKLAKEILRKGFDQPITIDEAGMIIKGHGRYLAVKALGWSSIPTIVRSDLTMKQANAMRIADNKLAESPWDWKALKDEILTLDDGSIDLQEETGFSKNEIEAMMAPYASGDIVPDDESAQNDSYGSSGKKNTCPNCGHEF